MENKPTKVYSSKQESMVAQALGWQVVSGSGAAPCAPGDVKSDDWLGECKTHASLQKIFFDLDVWKKIKEEAYATHRKPVLFADNGTQDLKHTWCLCSKSNLNLASLLTVALPYAIRKNVTFDDEKASQTLKKTGSAYCIGEVFAGIIYQAQWAGESVVIMPFSYFQELVNR